MSYYCFGINESRDAYDRGSIISGDGVRAFYCATQSRGTMGKTFTIDNVLYMPHIRNHERYVLAINYTDMSHYIYELRGNESGQDAVGGIQLMIRMRDPDCIPF